MKTLTLIRATMGREQHQKLKRSGAHRALGGGAKRRSQKAERQMGYSSSSCLTPWLSVIEFLDMRAFTGLTLAQVLGAV